jgi:flagellin FlaB
MGFSTAQDAKTTISSTLRGTEGILVVEGKVIASSYQTSTPSSLNVTSIPIKIARGGDSVNLDPGVTAVKYQSNQITYDNIYNGTLNSIAAGPFTSLESATNAAALPVNGGLLSESPFSVAGGGTSDWPRETTAFIYWTVQANTNDILEAGEHANLAVIFAKGDLPAELDTIRIELIVSAGAALTIERQIPNLTTEVVDLG